MIRDLINVEKLRRAALWLVYILAAELFQDTFLGGVRIFGVSMMFMPAVAVAIGAFEGGVWGAAFGLVAGFFADISFDYLALFVVLFPVMGFFAGVLTRWYVNASFFAYMCMCFAAFAATAVMQLLQPLYLGSALLPMLMPALVQVLWSLPAAAALYFPARAIATGGKKV